MINQNGPSSIYCLLLGMLYISFIFQRLDAFDANQHWTEWNYLPFLLILKTKSETIALPKEPFIQSPTHTGSFERVLNDLFRLRLPEKDRKHSLTDCPRT